MIMATPADSLSPDDVLRAYKLIIANAKISWDVPGFLVSILLSPLRLL